MNFSIGHQNYFYPPTEENAQSYKSMDLPLVYPRGSGLKVTRITVLMLLRKTELGARMVGTEIGIYFALECF